MVRPRLLVLPGCLCLAFISTADGVCVSLLFLNWVEIFMCFLSWELCIYLRKRGRARWRGRKKREVRMREGHVREWGLLPCTDAAPNACSASWLGTGSVSPEPAPVAWALPITPQDSHQPAARVQSTASQQTLSDMGCGLLNSYSQMCFH